MKAPDQRIIDIQADETIEQVAAKAGLEPKALLIVLGDFPGGFLPQVRSICSRVIAPLAVNPGALIVDNGSHCSCCAAIGAAVADQDVPPSLLGIAAAGSEELDPNHSLILRLPREWPNPIKDTFQIAATLAKDAGGREKPVIAVVFGGGDSEKTAVLRCVRRGWPVLLIGGTGGLADQIASAMTQPPDGSQPVPIVDVELSEIIDTACADVFPISGSIDDLKRMLLARIELRADTLADAWARYDDLDQGAILKQRVFKRLQSAILVLGVLATLLAIGLSYPKQEPWLEKYRSALHVLMVLTPIAISVLVAVSSRFREGNKWILLRATAENVKREIFRYRAQAGVYSEEQCKQVSRESKLSSKIKDLTSALAQSEVNRTSLPHHVTNEPERLKFLSADEYVRDRVQDQIDHMRSKTARLYRQLKRAQTWIYVAGGAGTFLAAMHGDVWVALTTAIAAALTTRLETEQVENTLVQYNQALISLRNIASWWTSLSQWEKSRPKNIDLLVDQTEKTLEGELAGWVQQMQSALDKLTEKEKEPSEQASRAAGA